MGCIARYTHASLSPDADDEIRLLYLEPARGNDNDDDNECECECDDNEKGATTTKALAISRNLHAALRRLRPSPPIRGGGGAPPASPRVLWADAACINQAVAREKTAQVRLIREIYSRPARVLVWLGEDGGGVNDSTDRELLRQLPACLRTALDLLPPEVFEAGELRQISQRVFAEALEVALADDGVPRLAICGDIKFAWEDLARVVYRLGVYGIATIHVILILFMISLVS
ncbi:hypothetical protein VTG60DRAFT_7301 [Thermothelomyces hinnuleus]